MSKAINSKTIIYRPVIEAAAGALVAHASGYDFNFVGLPTDADPATGINDIESVGYSNDDLQGARDMQLVMVRVSLGTEIITDIVRGIDPLRFPDADYAAYVEYLISDERNRRGRLCKVVDGPRYSAIRGTSGGEELVLLDSMRWVLDLIRDETAVRVLWAICARIEELKTVPSWTLELMYRSPDTPPRDFLDLDWHQNGLRKAIEQRMNKFKSH